MTPETADYLGKSREFLAKAIDMLSDGWADEAARAAYLKEEPRIERKFTRFLAHGYAFKEVADYAVGGQAVVTADEAQEMIDTARELVDRMATILS